MKPRTTAMLIFGGRMAVGAGLLLRPRRFGHGWVGDEVERPISEMLVRAVGARDLILGAGGLITMARGGTAHTWVQAGVAADSVDSALTLMAFRHLPTPGRLITLIVTVGGTIVGLGAAAGVDAQPPAEES